MRDRSVSLLRDIQNGALDSSTPLSDLLRKCVALGGTSGSRLLVNWASSELNGYEGKDDLPEYRIVPAPLLIDGVSGWTQIKRQHVAPSSLPAFAQDSIKEEVKFRQGVGTLEEFAARSEGDAVLIAPPGSSDLVSYWNQERNSDTDEIHRLYWSVSKSEVAGILHQIRNRLVKLIAEYEIEYQSAGSTAEAVERAVQITMGDGGSVAVVASAGSSANNVNLREAASPLEDPKWTLGRKIWTGAVGIAGIAGAIFAYLALPR